MHIRHAMLSIMLLAATAVVARAEPIPVENFVKFPEFESAVISPTGRYLAVTMPERGQTGLQIIDISNPEKGFKATAAYRFSRLTHVVNVAWASDERVVFETTREYDLVGDGVPRLTGMIYAINADGSDRMLISGSNRSYSGYASFVLDALPEDENNILIHRKRIGKYPAEAILLNIHDGTERVLATSPYESDNFYDNGFVLDRKGDVRLAYRYNMIDESLEVAERAAGSDEWKTRRFGKQSTFNPVGFLPDNKTLVVINDGDPLGLFAFDLDTGGMKPLVTHEVSAVRQVLRGLDGRAVVGAVFEPGVPERRLIDPDSDDARLYQLLGQAFGALHLDITSATRDHRLALVAVEGDRLPRDYYLFNAETLKADFLFSSMAWLDPAALSERRPVSFDARDGTRLHGYLTLPKGRKAADLPLVTIVHGGPHGIYDSWAFDYQAQLLASRGYAVLQTNFRGSGGYGRAFMEAGWQRWGTDIQNDIEDGVRWAVEQGIADRERLCIYGASFGGYSVLSQLTRNPDLFQCGFAFVGVYDLDLMLETGDVQTREDGRAFLGRVLPSDPSERRAQSPVHFVKNIKAALYVAHGQEDERAHPTHYYDLLDALDEAGIPHQTMLKHREGHGYFDMDNRIELYSALVEFLDEHIGED